MRVTLVAATDTISYLWEIASSEGMISAKKLFYSTPWEENITRICEEGLILTRKKSLAVTMVSFLIINSYKDLLGSNPEIGSMCNRTDRKITEEWILSVFSTKRPKSSHSKNS